MLWSFTTKKRKKWYVRTNIEAQMSALSAKRVSEDDKVILNDIVASLNDGDIEEGVKFLPQAPISVLNQ